MQHKEEEMLMEKYKIYFYLFFQSTQNECERVIKENTIGEKKNCNDCIDKRFG